MSSVIGLAGNCRMACPCLDGRCLPSHARRARADSIEPMAPDWLALHAVPFRRGHAELAVPGALYERYAAGKTGQRPRIARPPIPWQPLIPSHVPADDCFRSSRPWNKVGRSGIPGTIARMPLAQEPAGWLKLDIPSHGFGFVKPYQSIGWCNRRHEYSDREILMDSKVEQ